MEGEKLAALQGIEKSLRSGEAWMPDPYRVEIRQAASGAVQVSTRATAPDPDDAVEEAVRMYQATLRKLGEADANS